MLAQQIEVARPAVVGEPFPIAEQVRLEEGYEVGPSGILTLLQGQQASAQLTWFDRQGNVVGTIGLPGSYEEVHLSPDGQNLLFGRADPVTGNRDLWVHELTGDVAVRYTFDPATDHLAVFSPDGTWVAWETHSEGMMKLVQRPLNGSAPGARQECERSSHHATRR